MGILDTIKQKPDSQKKVFSFIGAVFLTLVILIVWLAFSREYKDIDTDTSKLSSVSPWQVMKDELSRAISDFSNTQDDSLSIKENDDVNSVLLTDTVQSTSTDNSTSSTILPQATSTNE